MCVCACACSTSWNGDGLGHRLCVPKLQSDADFGPFMRIDTMPDLPVCRFADLPV